MVLPAILYSIPDALFDRVMERIAPISRETNVSLRIELRTDDPVEASRALEEAKGILLLITCVSDTQEEGVQALQLGRLAVQGNRDRYVIYCARDSRTMIAMAPWCARPAAIVTNMILEAQAPRVMRDIFRDYSRLQMPAESAEWITVRDRGALRRIRTGEILGVAAANKMIEIILAAERIAVYDTLESFAKQLDERFARCHRSAIVNVEMIRHVDFHGMAITLLNNQQLPLSRAFRQAFHRLAASADGRTKAGGV